MRHLANRTRQESRRQLSLVQDAVQSKLKKRSDFRDEKVRPMYLFMLRFNVHLVDLPAPAPQDLRVRYSPRVATSNSLTRKTFFS